MTSREEWLAGAEQRRTEPLREDRPEDVTARLGADVTEVFADPATGLTVTLRPGPPPPTPSGAVGDRYEIRTTNPVRLPDRLVLTAAEFAALTRWVREPG